MKQSLQAFVPYDGPCLTGRLIRRVKRFSVEIALENGERIWAHSNNSGAMLGLTRQGEAVLVSQSGNPKRKLAYTLEAVESGAGHGRGWVGVNTLVPNRLLQAAFSLGQLPFAQGYAQCKREAVWGDSRLDSHFFGQREPDLWVECKNVTLVEDDVASFPDAPSLRAQKHLKTLRQIVAQKRRAAMFYLVQHPEGHCFAPADFIDPDYAAGFVQAVSAGVEIYVFRASVTKQGVFLAEPMPLASAWA